MKDSSLAYCPELSDAAPFVVKVLSTPDEIESIREFWSDLQSVPAMDIDFFLFTLRFSSGKARPHVLVVYEAGEPVSLLVGRIEEIHLEMKFGYTVLFRPRVRRLIIGGGGFMGRNDEVVTRLVIGQVMQSLRGQGVELLHWETVPWKGGMQRLLESSVNPLCRDFMARPYEHWMMNLPESLEQLFEQRMNKKHRYWARRTMRVLEKDFPGEVRQLCYSAPGEMQKLFQDTLAVARKTYQWGLGVGFQDDEFHRQRLDLESGKGWLRGYVMYLKNEPVAFWICTVYQDTVYLDYTGYDPEFRKYEIGTILLFRVIADMCEQKLKFVDFGLGAAMYKEKFGDSRTEEVTVGLFALSFRGVFLNALKLLTVGPAELARKGVKRLGLEAKLKKFWRARAAQSQAAQSEKPVEEPAEPALRK